MADKKMACWNCPRYDRTERRCREGKTNPKKKADALAVAELLGLRALCHYNPYRDAFAIRRHFPSDPVAISTISSARLRHARRRTLSIEIEETEIEETEIANEIEKETEETEKIDTEEAEIENSKTEKIDAEAIEPSMDFKFA